MSFGTMVSELNPLAERGLRVKVQLSDLIPSAVKGPFGNADLLRDRFDRDIHKTHVVNACEGQVVLTAAVIYPFLQRPDPFLSAGRSSAERTEGTSAGGCSSAFSIRPSGTEMLITGDPLSQERSRKMPAACRQYCSLKSSSLLKGWSGDKYHL